jgi:hypothetical protein
MVEDGRERSAGWMLVRPHWRKGDGHAEWQVALRDDVSTVQRLRAAFSLVVSQPFGTDRG